MTASAWRRTLLWSLSLSMVCCGGGSRKPPPADPSATTTATTHYAYYCADCHGPAMDGGMASSLIDGRWDYGASDAAIFASIAVGIPEDGMPGFGAVMDAAQIDALVHLMRETERVQSH
ncbi:MAG: cytochrome c [Gemmatimonadetes bacterium]|nr:cytochrome c [Gemmatimonadota bacterium]MYB68997.1 cytochrome c [Gemmatimonadota bacterium]